MPNHYSTIIIGAGLSGLYAAWKCHQQKQNFIVLESRERCGGRILSANAGALAESNIDLGPAWVWPQHQPRLAQLINDLNLSLFKQYTEGDKIYEHDTKHCERYHDQSPHSESYRIAGGSVELVNALLSRLPESSIKLNTRVQGIKQSPLLIHTINNQQTCEYTADKIILALPPRLIEQSITFTPSLPTATQRLWHNTPTWMAAHSKVIFIYDKPFWRQQGLSGEAFSRAGPLSEICDGSPANEEYYALTCFVGLSASQRKPISEDNFKSMCMVQLQRLFGDESQRVKNILIKDWSLDQHTSHTSENVSLSHPEFPNGTSRTEWEGKLLLAGSEVASESAGYLEGAIESADAALQL